MKKLIISLFAVVSFAMAESCVLSQYVKDQIEGDTYSIREVCIDKNLYTSTVDGKSLSNIVPMVVIKDGKQVQKTCECELVVNEKLANK